METHQTNRIKGRIQKAIVIVSIVLLVGKFTAYALTQSVGILTDAMESIVNVVASLVSLYAIIIASRPVDQGHPFGHGKAELISAMFEGALIFMAGGLIIWEGFWRILEPEMPQKLDVGIIIVAVAAMVNCFMGWYALKKGKKHNSQALIASGKHLLSDTYSSIGLVIGLVLLFVTKLSWIDGALALMFGGIIIFTGIGVIRSTVRNLMDRSDQQLLCAILDKINTNRQKEWIDIHNMKILKNGNMLYIDCDLTLPWYYNIREAHNSMDILKAITREGFSETLIFTIHNDGCNIEQCKGCRVEHCQYRASEMKELSPLTLSQLLYKDE